MKAKKPKINKGKRELIIVKIIHSMEDLGSMGGGLAKDGMEKFGRKKWQESQKSIEKLWEVIEKQIEELDIDLERTRVYQDSLPCGGEIALRIINEIAARGSKNFQIIKKLLDGGATIEATENKELLRKEYEHLKSIVMASGKEEKIESLRLYENARDRLMDDRDGYIAKIIDSTLKEEETGLLFIGAAHDVISKLPKNIKIKNIPLEKAT
jgi:hypothetical protein